jgi:two-component system sensor histidine kinase ArlS
MDALLIAEARPYIEKMIRKNQLVRIIGKNGEPLLTVANHFDENWVTPRIVATPELFDITYKEDHILIYRSPFITTKFVGTFGVVHCQAIRVQVSGGNIHSKQGERRDNSNN